MAAQSRNTEHVGGPTIIPEIEEFYLEMQDELKAIKDKLGKLQISPVPNVVNAGESTTPNFHGLGGDVTPDLTLASESLALAKHLSKCDGFGNETLWNYPEWKQFVNSCLRLRMEHANIQVPIQNMAGSHAYSCSVVLGNISNTNLTYPNTWFDAGTCMKYQNMPQLIAHNQTGSFCFHGDSATTTGLCTYNVIGESLVIQYFVNYDERAFIVGFSPMTADLATQMHHDFMRDNWASFTEKNFVYRTSRQHLKMEATVSFKNLQAKVLMTPGVSNFHALITALVSELP